MADQPAPSQRIPQSALNLVDLAPGTRVRLSNDATAEVVSNPRDGMWLQLRYLTVPDDPARAGTEELVFAEDVIAVL